MPIDWLSPAQCFGYLAFVLGVASFLQTNDRRFKQLMIGECLGTIALFLLQGIPMRLLMLCGTGLWITNNVIVGSIGGTALEVTIAVVNITTIIRLQARQSRQSG